NESSLRYIVLPNWTHDALLESTSSKPYEESISQVPEGSGNSNPTASAFIPPANQMETLTVESPIPTVSLPVPTACLNDSSEPSSEARLVSKRVAIQEETPSLDNILSLTNRFDDILRVSTSSDEIIGVEADLFDIDSLTKSMNYVPVDAGTNSTNLSGTKSVASQEVNKDVSSLRYIPLPNWVHDALLESSSMETPIPTVSSPLLTACFTDYPEPSIYQMNVKSAFLYGTIDKEVYVTQPPGFQDPEFPAKVYKVEKAMYGLHQAPRA
nr:retrotransposon protein, putative, unclassified [Tanacetum cinerariifolium]